MQVDRYKIHDIELVIDRLQVTNDLKARLGQSVQQALKLGKDLMFLAPSKSPPEEETSPKWSKKKEFFEAAGSSKDPPLEGMGEASYSRQLMCEDTGISYEEPSPNAFSFNSPYGACPTCKGLGTVFQVNMDAILPDHSMSIKDGAIAPLGEEREAYVFKQVHQLAKKYKINLEKPIKDLSQKALNVLL